MSDKNKRSEEQVIKTSVELLTCPFCGGEAQIETFHDCVEGTNDIFVRCKVCKAQTIEIGTDIMFGSEMPIMSAVEAVVRAWNTRKPMEQIIEKMEVLKTDASVEEFLAIYKAIGVVKGEFE